jgi:hypothetical protein
VAVDLPLLEPLVERASDILQRGFLDDAQIASSHAIMGIDRQLIEDRTYYVVEIDDVVAGCVRAMYPRPDSARRGIGRLVPRTCEEPAAAEGFRTLELVSTSARRPLYGPAGFVDVADLEDAARWTSVPLVRLSKVISAPGN